MKNLLLSIVASGAFFFASAQNIQIFTNTWDDVTDSTYEYNLGSGIQTEVYLYTENLTDSAMNIGLKRYEINVPSGTQNYFCWFECYLPTPAGDQVFWPAPDAIEHEADSVYNKFVGYHMPQGIVEDATYRYVWFDEDNPMDSVSVDIVFKAPNSTAEELALPSANINAWPNPANDVLTVDFNSKNTTNPTIVVRNLLGNQVAVEQLNGTNGQARIDVSELPAGTYLVSLQEGENRLSTKKVIVSH